MLWLYLFTILVILKIDKALPSPIIGGELLTPLKEYSNLAYQTPFMVSLQQIVIKPGKPTTYYHFCGGILLNNRWILTAAHCLYERNIRETFAVIGQLNLHQALESSAYYALDRVEFIYFQPKNFRNDIALAHLRQQYLSPFTLRDNFAKLPKLGMRAYREKPCKIIGYGAIESYGEAQDDLREAQVYVIKNRVCRQTLGHVWGPQPGSNSFCALGDQQDSCQGDSGGPLLCYVNEQYYVYGIVSYGLSCALPNVPGIYTAVIPYLEWINIIINT